MAHPQSQNSRSCEVKVSLHCIARPCLRRKKEIVRVSEKADNVPSYAHTLNSRTVKHFKTQFMCITSVEVNYVTLNIRRGKPLQPSLADKMLFLQSKNITWRNSESFDPLSVSAFFIN